MTLKEYAIHNFPALGIIKRKYKATVDCLLPLKKSYSQHGEDVFIRNFLSERKNLEGIYIDVGANHPTSISNTFLFYRLGYSGLTIEPNPELAKLHKNHRKRDKIFEIGIADKAGICQLNISKTPVLSSFCKVDEHNLWKTKLVPILTLDDVVSKENPKRIFLLSIDTEGQNMQVLMGAELTITLADLICIEKDTDEEGVLITNFLTSNKGFRKIKDMGCNLIFANEKLFLKRHI